MRSGDYLTTQQIRTIFAEEISERGGTVREEIDDGSRLFARAVLRELAEVRPGDKVQGGVAIRASDEEVSVHPYTYRLVCKNGAIHAESIETRQLVDAEFFSAGEAECALRETIQLCCAPEAFGKTARQMRTAADAQVDMLLTIAPFLSRMRGRERERFMAEVIAHLPPDRRGTRYDLVNLVTAAARDTRDPEAKWRLEELGGAVAAGVVPPQPDASARRRVGRLVPA